MGGQCCTERKDGNAKGGAGKDAGGAGKGKEVRKSLAQGYDKKTKMSIATSNKGDDAEKFDQAFETNDLQAFVNLLKSAQKIEPFEERMHPWAEDPKTVGALAGTQLAILASTADGDSANVKDDIRNAGGIPPLVGFLKCAEDDRIQTAIVALSFLTAENAQNSKVAYDAGALPELMKYMDAKLVPMRAAVATTLRNICVEDDAYRKQFVELGGLKALVNQLDIPAGEATNVADVQLEAILNLQDIIEGEEGQVIKEYAQQVIAAGAEDKLKKLAQSDDEEVQSSANEALTLLKDAK